MIVFKFGGASVKNADAVRNVAKVIGFYPNDSIVVVVSAMAKTTNALEQLVDAFFYKKGNTSVILNEINDFHFSILNDLFPDKKHTIYDEIANAFVELEWALDDEPTHDYDCEYDQMVSVGETISTKIVSAYLNEIGLQNKWQDIRDCIKTDNKYRAATVDWDVTTQLIQQVFTNKIRLTVTQGFIGCTSENFTTTLGREGSDYTAAIIAHALQAESVTIWKDVPGVLNADPKWFSNTELIPQLSYQDAIELAYYGATVIHPKTIKPLQNKQIPLFVKSFLQPNEKGTVINQAQTQQPIPCFIFKVNQVLLSISPKDFSFIIEENLRDIFDLFSLQGITINTMQNSAISFSLCFDYHEQKLNELVNVLKQKYRVLYNTGVELITIRYYNQQTIDRVCDNKNVLLEVRSRTTTQLVVK